MKRSLDTIKFENRYEVTDLMGIMEKYIEQNPEEKNNVTLERFLNLLDVIDMEW